MTQFVNIAAQWLPSWGRLKNHLLKNVLTNNEGAWDATLHGDVSPVYCIQFTLLEKYTLSVYNKRRRQLLPYTYHTDNAWKKCKKELNHSKTIFNNCVMYIRKKFDKNNWSFGHLSLLESSTSITYIGRCLLIRKLMPAYQWKFRFFIKIHFYEIVGKRISNFICLWCALGGRSSPS